MTLDELAQKIGDIDDTFTFEDDNSGQIIIYTGLRIKPGSKDHELELLPEDDGPCPYPVK